ncbi:MAG: hypothetical protein WCI91_00350 [Candidatus Nomurabacteria bacterium]
MNLLAGIIVGFLFFKLFAGKYEGDKIERSLRFSIKNNYLHIHHWIFCLTLLIIILILGFKNELIIGLLIGSIVQGLTYKDRFLIIYSKS